MHCKFFMNLLAQSICTHYSSLLGRPDIFLGSGTGKKSGPKKYRLQKNRVIVIQKEKRPCSNVSTTPITAMGCRQFLPLSVVQLKGKHCRKPHCRNGVVDTFGPDCLFSFWITTTRFFAPGFFLDLIFFQGHKPTHVFKTRIVGPDWLGDFWQLRLTTCGSRSKF